MLNSLCHSQQLNLNNTSKDKAFIKSYKNKAIEYDDLRDNLIGNIESSAPDKIEQAKGVCTNLKVGVSAEKSGEYLDNNSTPADRINTLIINSFAVKIYCPSSGK